MPYGVQNRVLFVHLFPVLLAGLQRTNLADSINLCFYIFLNPLLVYFDAADNKKQFY